MLAFTQRYRSTVLNALGEDVGDIAPCTPLQEGILSRSLAGDFGLYFNTLQLKLAETVDGPQMRRAWEKLYADVPVLRTRFVHTDEGFAQAVLQHPALPWEELDISDSSTLGERIADRRRKWLTTNGKKFEKPFEIILMRSATESRLIINIFHALYDANSINLVLRLLLCRYTQQKMLSLETDFIQALPHGPLLEVDDADEFWKTQMPPTDSVGSLSIPPPAIPSGHFRMSLDLKCGRHLEIIRRQLHVTHQAIFQACWLAVLQQFAFGHLVIGIVVSGRQLDLAGAENVVGPMFNTIPFKLDLYPRDTWVSVIRRSHNFNVAALPFQHTPLRRIYKIMKRPPQQPLFESLFVFQKTTAAATLAAANEVWTLMPSEAVMDYPLALEVEWSEGDDISLQLTGRGDMLTEAMASAMLNDLKSVLGNVISNQNDVANLPRPIFQHTHPIYIAPIVGDDVAMVDVPEPYVWTAEAELVRREISVLLDIVEDEISEQSSIFELGIDSIDVIKLASRLKKAGLSIAVSKIMQQPYVSDIIRNATAEPQQSSSESFDINDAEDRLTKLLTQNGFDLSDAERVLPCTPLQEGMLVEMSESNLEQYYNVDFLEVSTEVDITMLRRAWSAALAGAPILRTAFTQMDAPEYEGAWAQVVSRYRETPWLSLRCDDDQGSARVVEFIKEDVAQSPAAPAFRIILLQQPLKMILIIALPHAMYDGWSLQILHNAVSRIYHGEMVAFPANDLALSQIMGGSRKQSREFWKNYLFGATPCLVPIRGDDGSTTASVLPVKERTSSISLDTIRTFCKRHSVTLQALGQLCWTLVLAQRLRTLNVAFGVVLSGRDSIEMQEVLFPTMNTVAFRSFVHGSRRDMLRYTHETMASIREHQYFPLSRAQRFADAPNGKLFNTIFIQQMNRVESKPGSTALYKSIRTAASVEHAICVEFEIIDESFVWRAACKPGAFDETGPESVIHSLDKVLANLVNDIDGSAFDIEGHDLRIDDLTSRSDPPTHVVPSTNRDRDTEMEMSATEKRILAAVSAISKVPEDQINRGDTIFSLGLDSISAMKVSAILRKESVFLSVSQILKGLTIGGIVKLAEAPVETQEEAGDGDGISTSDYRYCANNLRIPLDSIEHVLPATAGQVYTLANWRVSNGNQFFQPHNLSVNGNIPRESILAAWDKLLEHNPILRTVFLPTSSPSVPIIQVILKAGPSAQTGFRIRISTYADVQVGEKKNKRWPLTLRIHHALYDAISLRHLFRQLSGFLLETSKGTDALPYDPFLNLVRRSYADSAILRAQKYWTGYLDGADKDFSYFGQPTYVANDVACYQPGLDGIPTRIDEVARIWGVSTPALLIAAWGKFYYEEVALRRRPNFGPSSCHDVVLGVYMANRSLSINGLDQVAAPTFNVVPLRIRSPNLNAVGQIAKQVQRDLVELRNVEVAMTPLWQIKQWTGVTVGTFINVLPPEEDICDGSDDDNVLINEDDKAIDKPHCRVCARKLSSAVSSVVTGKDVADKLVSGLEDKQLCEAYPVSLGN